jgi:hypothetical protein
VKNVKDAIKIIIIQFQANFAKNVPNIHFQMLIELHVFHMTLFYQKKDLIIYFFMQGQTSIVNPRKISISATKIKLLSVQLSSKMIKNWKTKIYYFFSQIDSNLIQIYLNSTNLSNPLVYSQIIHMFIWFKTLKMHTFHKLKNF